MNDSQIRYFPNPSGLGKPVAWTGKEFEGVGRVLAYSMPSNPDGWNDGLTDFHEEISHGEHPVDRQSMLTAMDNIQYAFQKGKYEYGADILEIGCSGGHLLEQLCSYGRGKLCGADIVNVTLERLGERLEKRCFSVPLLRFDITDCPLPSESFDIVVALNVLEHIENDENAMSEIARILKPGGAFVFEVPIGSNLYDDYDRAMRHFRRYDPKSLSTMFENHGFIEGRVNYLGTFLYPAFYMMKKFRRNILKNSLKKGKLDSLSQNLIKITSGNIVRLMFKLENIVNSTGRFNFGIRYNGVFFRKHD